MNFDFEAKEAILKFELELKEMFPDFIVKLSIVRNLGTTLWIDIVSPYKVTRHNADVNLSFHIFKEDGIPSLEKNLCPKKYKFRKINGKSIDEMVEKFVKWASKKQPELIEDWVNYK